MCVCALEYMCVSLCEGEGMCVRDSVCVRGCKETERVLCERVCKRKGCVCESVHARLCVREGMCVRECVCERV